jgi:hypothetical protein
MPAILSNGDFAASRRLKGVFVGGNWPGEQGQRGEGRVDASPDTSNGASPNCFLRAGDVFDLFARANRSISGAMRRSISMRSYITGEPMPRYLSQHSLACLTRQGAEQLSRKMFATTAVSAKRVLVNMHEGKMLVEFDAGSREELEKWFAAEKFHFDWLLRVEWESRADGSLEPA